MSTNDSLDLEQFSKKLQNNLKKSQTRAKKIDQEESLPESDKKEGNTFFSEDPFETKKNTTKFMSSNEYETKKNIFPQIIDEDTENYKTKLDYLINIFKNDTLSEFMGMKKALLDKQTKTIKSETEQYLTMYETNKMELEKTKSILVEKIAENENLNKKLYSLAGKCGETKNILRNQRILLTYFSKLKDYKQHRAFKKKLNKMGEAFERKRIFTSTISTWKSNVYNMKLEKSKSHLTDAFNQEIAELTIKYNKEIELLTGKLKENEGIINELNISKEQMQENLKKAFMRGVCALNFEAMSILTEKKNIEKEPNNFLSQTILKNEDLFKTASNPPTSQPDAHQNDKNNINSNIFGNLMNSKTLLPELKEDESPTISNSKKVIFYQQPKLESKDYKWREAPVVGVNHIENIPEIKNLNTSVNEEARENQKKIDSYCALKERINVIEKKDQIEGKIIVVDPHKIVQQSYQEINSKLSKGKNNVIQTDKKNGGVTKSQPSKLK